MPTYEYSCEKCEKSFEVRQSMKDPHLKECPQELCRMAKWGHGKVRRQMGLGAGLIFKGSGFYITDYRSEGYKQAAQKESAAVTPAASDGGDSASAGSTTTPTTPNSSPASPAKSEKRAKSGKPAKAAGKD
jgi:putative FmdB family regulatory protein